MALAQKISVYRGKLQRLLLEPVLVGPLWCALAKGPDKVKEPLIQALANVVSEDKIPKIVTALQWMLVIGLLGKANRFLSDLALNHWKLRANKKDWVWDREVAVLTGGCSGIGLLVAQGLREKGVKVAILDIQPLPKDLQGCTSEPTIAPFQL